MSIASRYQFNLTFPGGGSSGEAKPVNDSLQFAWVKVEGKRYFRKTLTTALSFQNLHGNENIKDFDPWYKLELARERCKKVELEVNAKCDEAYEEVWKGYSTIIKADIDAGLCKADVKFEPNDPYQCIYTNWEKEKNVLQTTQPQTVNVIQGQYQISQTCMEEVTGLATETFRFSQTIVTNCINQNEGWTLWKQFYSWVSAGDPQNPDLGTWSLQTQWIREFLAATEDPGGDWLPVDGGGYARPVPLRLTFENVGYGIIQRQFEVVFPGDIGIDNGRFLNDIILDFWEEYCGFPIVSNFFGINPDGTQPDNDAYTKALADLQELMVFAKGDIIRHDADENNTILNFSLKRLFEHLENIFNVEGRFIDDVFYLEHYSYFKKDLFLDLTTEERLPEIKDSFGWTYAEEKVPPRERFQWEDYSDSEPLDQDFDGLPISYPENCSTQTTDTIYEAANATTNVTKLVESGDPEQWTITPESFVLVATSGGYILREAGAITGIVQLNAMLAWANLQRDYWKWGRPLKQGRMNGQIQDFISTIKIRKQYPIELHMCCSELKDFDPDRIVIKTQLGHGEVDSATYDEPNELLTLNLIFD